MNEEVIIGVLRKLHNKNFVILRFQVLTAASTNMTDCLIKYYAVQSADVSEVLTASTIRVFSCGRNNFKA
jgi:hypothetical protein